ncbi:MAG: PAS domain S-box protein [Deltaproteobacteria bacterium]|nr:PAS domain S-box protein [Deltaproteobacteria bacterium]
MTKSGQRVDVSVAQSPIRDANGKLLSVSLIVRDITARKLAEQALQTSEQSIRRLYEITNAPELAFEQRLRALLEFGCARFDISYGFLTTSKGEELEIIYVHAPDGAFAEGSTIPMSAAFCSSTMRTDEPICNEHVGASEWRTHPGYLALGMECYMGTKVIVDGGIYGTLCFLGAEPHDDLFTDPDKDFLKLMSVWIGGEIARRQAAQALRAAHDELERRVEERTAELAQAVASLTKTEALLRQAVEVADLGIFERDHVTNELNYSPTMREILDFSEDQQIKPGEFLAIVHPDDRETVRMARQQAQVPAGVGQMSLEFRIVRRDGSIGWILNRARTFFDGTGDACRSVRTVGAILDITKRKQAEQALRESEERLQHALAVGQMGTWERDLCTDTETWDRRTYEIFGIETGTAVDFAVFSSRIHQEDLPSVKESVLRTERTGSSYEYDYRFVRPDGNTRWIRSNGGLRRDANGMPTHIAGINFDITERRQAEEALRESEARMRAILDHSPAPVFIKDCDGRYLLVNCRFEEMFGLGDANCLGKTDSELFAAEQAAAFQMHDREVLDRGAGVQFEEVAQYQDGSHTSIVNKFPLRDGAGKIYALCGIATDITERKRTEDELHQLNQELDQRVARRTEQLAESRANLRTLVAELTRAEERERRRLAVELHDYLAQSLTATRMNLSRADKFVANFSNSSDLKKILYEVHSDLNNSINYTRTLIAELSPRVLYDLGLVAALSWLGEQMGRHGLTVEVDGPREGFSVAEDDAVFLFQCARELLWNVVKHGDTNQATVAFGRDGDRVSVVVIDNGKGFDAQSTANGNGGSHYGLFSIRERVELRGGRVEIDSTPGVGTWVTIILPVDQHEEGLAEMVTPDIQQKAFGTVIKIVIVDDHKMVRQGLRRILEEHEEFTVVGEAGDGAEAIAMARELEPNVVIMDVNLPTMSGIDATQAIIRDRPSTIVIGVSFGSDSYVSQAMQAAGAVTCIAKERAVEDVHRAIIDAMDGRWVDSAR